ncbi:energy-coupling factor transporter transmembrane protein EcfT [Arthrobacter sp. CAU 1506]|uniref:energy-coupling factor transporter transmembrane component T family protein n=1 Tax=Arthrobacter sp. CAU 1506 TaxID=2560052 RepID=UPI0010AD8E72|nr:energy-coupling factor transporter transmembrane component T [Arthrobacter sp. CAU 1506]TJY64144.1 energy-coupling factor transporter transmembrane protein EcfT [Arthrobacter sp. CAU 1506]
MTAATTSAFTASGSVLARRNPTVKLALLFVVSLAMVFVFDPVTPAVLYIVALATIQASTRLPVKAMALGHVPFVAFGLGIFLVNALSRPGQILWEAGPVRVTVEGLSVGGSLALRTLVIGILAIGFVASTDGVALMGSLHQHARLGSRVTYAVLAGYRMLQEMPREWQTIRQAHAVRARLRPDGTLPRGLSAYRRAAFALLVVSVRKGERMAQSLESRGLGLSPRTTWRKIPLNSTDWLMATTVLAVLGGILALSHILGFLEGYDALFS